MIQLIHQGDCLCFIYHRSEGYARSFGCHQTLLRPEIRGSILFWTSETYSYLANISHASWDHQWILT